MSNALSTWDEDYVRDLGTVDECIDALGGTAAVARLCEVSPQVVSDWRRRAVFPPGRYLRLSNALAEISCVAPLSIFQMQPSKPEEDAYYD